MPTPKEIFEKDIPANLAANPDKAKSMKATYKFIIGGANAGTWRVCLGDNPRVEEGDGEAQCTITVGDDDFVNIVGGKLNPQMAFMSGKLKVAGDMGLAMKLGQVLNG
jgi:putative sterol carrier protein